MKDGKTPDPLDVKLVPDKPTGLAALSRKIFGGEADTRPSRIGRPLLDAIQFVPDGTEVRTHRCSAATRSRAR